MYIYILTYIRICLYIYMYKFEKNMSELSILQKMRKNHAYLGNGGGVSSTLRGKGGYSIM